jgi:hypothetical protein
MPNNNQHIHCTVSNCHYWGSGNMCAANEILVTSDTVGQTEGNSMDATQASTMSQTPVNTCSETTCKTFAQKGSRNQFAVDGVMKTGGSQTAQSNQSSQTMSYRQPLQ